MTPRDPHSVSTPNRRGVALTAAAEVAAHTALKAEAQGAIHTQARIGAADPPGHVVANCSSGLAIGM
jgi:hypothetical protein